MVTRPNILLIMDDQHRHDYLGCAGSTCVDTPALDKLARGGLMFTHCTTNAPVCAPARIGLATGMQPVHIGALDNSAHLSAGADTYYKRLRDADYRVGLVGKLDLAKPFPLNGRFGDRPRVFGFGFTHPEECEGKMHAGGFQHPAGPYTHYLQEQGLLEAFHSDYVRRGAGGWLRDAMHDSVLPADATEDAYVGRRAVQWIETVPEDFPWHLVVSFVGPHDPYDPPAAHGLRYRDRPMDKPVPVRAVNPAYVASRLHKLTDEETLTARRQYGALVSHIDEHIGHILDALDRKGVRERTYVLFVSDHGEMLGDLGLFTKHVPYEAAMRVPLIVAGPDVRSGECSDALVELIDLHPTILELAGVLPPREIDARSIVPVLRGDSLSHRSATVCAERGYRAVRTRSHKLIEYDDGSYELFDLIADPHETVNHAVEHPTLVETLAATLRASYSRRTYPM